MRIKNLSMVDIARYAGISRQAVSLWFKQGTKEGRIDLHNKHFMNLISSLNIKAEDLISPFFVIDRKSKDILKVELLWDNLYESIEEFAIALVQHDNRAVGRLVQTWGLFKSFRVIGSYVWKKFYKYKKYIEPSRRKECEVVWNLQKNLGLI